MYEYRATIPTLWDAVKEFTKENPQYVAKNNAMRYMSDDNGNSYNLCHCTYARSHSRDSLVDTIFLF